MGWGVRTDRMWGYWQGNLYVLLRCRACVRVPGAQILVLCVVVVVVFISFAWWQFLAAISANDSQTLLVTRLVTEM